MYSKQNIVKNQKNIIKKLLAENGEISRNQALSMYISRLGSIICKLKKEGYQFTTENRGGDYVYKVYKPQHQPEMFNKSKELEILTQKPLIECKKEHYDY